MNRIAIWRFLRYVVCAVLVTSPVLAGKVYQYKDANGNLVFSDQPPPGQKVDSREVKTNSIQTSGGGYALREAIRKSPVVLWATTNCGAPCDDARNLLQVRGIPYTGRNPATNAANLAEFQKLAGDSVVPLLQVGNTVQRGFLEPAWNTALDDAGYPRTPDPTLKNAPLENKVAKPLTPPPPPPSATPPVSTNPR